MQEVYYRKIRKEYIENKSWPLKSSFKIIRPNNEIHLIEQVDTKCTFQQRNCLISVVRSVTSEPNSGPKGMKNINIFHPEFVVNQEFNLF
jgi:hypothetical protein